MKKAVIPVFIPHLGCEYDCVFCNQKKITGVLPPAGRDVTEIINKALTKLPPGRDAEAAFYGGSFTAIDRKKQENILSAVLPFIKDGKISSVRVSTRPDAVDKERLELLRRYNVTAVEIGIQSMDNAVLKLSGRGHDAKASYKASELIRGYGFELTAQMMCYLPGDEDGQASLYTALEIIKMKPDCVRIYPAVVIKETELYERWKAGLYSPADINCAAELCGRLIDMFIKADIKILRIGLNPTEELSGGEAAAGVYHPAFGELAYGEYYFKTACETILREYGSKVVLYLPEGRVSALTGHGGRQKKRIIERFGLHKLKILPAKLPEGQVKAGTLME